MSSSLYEIVELSNGEVVLRHADDTQAEPLVKICFSQESLQYLGDAKFAVAKAMIEAGMDAASEGSEVLHDDFIEDDIQESERILH